MNSSPHRAANATTAAMPPITHCALPVTIAIPPVLTLEVLTPAEDGAGPVSKTTLVVVFGPGVMVEREDVVVEFGKE
jgi:hypothetical protein